MTSRKLVAIGFALQLIAVPAMAQTAVDDKNAHHYQGGPKTVVPHQMTHPKTTELRKSPSTPVITTMAGPGQNPITWARRSNCPDFNPAWFRSGGRCRITAIVPDCHCNEGEP